MAPDVRKTLEVGGRVLLPVLVVPDLDRHPEAGALDFAAPYRERQAAENEAGHDVGTAENRRQQKIRLDLPIDEIETLRRQRAARGQ